MIQATITPRELQVINLLRAHKQYKDVARELGMETSTVKSHLRSVKIKLQIAGHGHMATRVEFFEALDQLQGVAV